MSDLRSHCPYCGETSVTVETMVHESEEQWGVYDHVTYYGLCQACRHYGPDCTTKSGAILAYRSAMEAKRDREAGCIKCRLAALIGEKKKS